MINETFQTLTHTPDWCSAGTHNHGGTCVSADTFWKPLCSCLLGRFSAVGHKHLPWWSRPTCQGFNKSPQIKTDFIPKHLPQILAGWKSDMLHDYKTYKDINQSFVHIHRQFYTVPKLQSNLLLVWLLSFWLSLEKLILCNLVQL